MLLPSHRCERGAPSKKAPTSKKNHDGSCLKHIYLNSRDKHNQLYRIDQSFRIADERPVPSGAYHSPRASASLARWRTSARKLALRLKC